VSGDSFSEDNALRTQLFFRTKPTILDRACAMFIFLKELLLESHIILCVLPLTTVVGCCYGELTTVEPFMFFFRQCVLLDSL
jgi:hypothetical protein